MCGGAGGGGRAHGRGREGGVDSDEEDGRVCDDLGALGEGRRVRKIAGAGLLALGQQARGILPTSLLCKIASTRTTVSTIMESVSVVLSAAAASFDSPSSSASSVSRVICAESTCTASEREEGRGHTSSSRTTPCLRTSCRPISSKKASSAAACPAASPGGGSEGVLDMCSWRESRNSTGRIRVW